MGRVVSAPAGDRPMPFRIEVERETDGRWFADIPQLPGTTAYGVTPEKAVSNVQALGLRVLADRIEHGEDVPEGVMDLFAVPA